MKFKSGNLSEYFMKNKRFSLLFLVVLLVVAYVGMDIFGDIRMRSMGGEPKEAEKPLITDEIVTAEKEYIDLAEDENDEVAKNSQDYNIYMSDDNGMSGNEAESETGMVAGTETDSDNKIITKEEIEAIKEVMAEKAALEAAEAEAAAAEEEAEEEYEPEPKPIYKPKPEPEPEPEPVVEVRNIELIVHIHFVDENGKSLAGQAVEIYLSRVGGGSIGSTVSDGEDARISVPAVNCIISGQEIAGFTSDGSKTVYISDDDDSVKHVSYRYRKSVQ